MEFKILNIIICIKILIIREVIYFFLGKLEVKNLHSSLHPYDIIITFDVSVIRVANAAPSAPYIGIKTKLSKRFIIIPTKTAIKRYTF